MLYIILVQKSNDSPNCENYGDRNKSIGNFKFQHMSDTQRPAPLSLIELNVSSHVQCRKLIVLTRKAIVKGVHMSDLRKTTLVYVGNMHKLIQMAKCQVCNFIVDKKK